jgi:hypothetical protein
MRRIVKYALWGTSGFGVGGAIGGVVWVASDAPQLGFPIMGAVGGASLGAALKDGKRAVLLALAGAIGIGIGFLGGFFTLLTIWEPIRVEGLFLGVVGGSLGGASFGLSLRSWRKAGLLSLAGAVGFGVAVQAFLDVLRGLEPQVLWGAITLAIWGIVGGAFLGTALGYLENRRSINQSW